MLHPREDYNHRIQDNEKLIPEDEPVLLLRAQDALSDEVVELYAQLCERTQPLEVAARIREHVNAMKAWATKKIPDVPL